MAIKKVKPTTNARRQYSVESFADVTKKDPERSLLAPLTKKGGRNNNGRITTRHQGGGHKRRYRIIDFKRDKHDIPAKVAAIEYDPNRSARIALLVYADGEKRYIIAPNEVQVGQTVVSGAESAPESGNCLPLSRIPIGSFVHAIEMKPGKGAQLARSAGAYAQLVGRDQGYAQIRLGSGELRMVLDGCMATVGAVSNPDHMNQNLGKAGRVRHMGWRPHVRGVAMNPIDHPHGGGEGRTSGGRTPVTPWGKDTKGTRTRKNKATDKFIIRTRHVKKAR